jgi:uncharacterized protein YheU (UPF0270 family)
MEIPLERLTPDVLKGIIEEFVLREGTDYGSHEYSLSDKVAHVMKQLQAGQAVVVFNQDTETCDILTKRQFVKTSQAKKV